MPGKVFRMNPNRTTPAKAASKAPTVNADREKGVTPDVDRSDLAKPLAPDILAKIERAAMPCPSEFRPAYIHLLEELCKDNRDCNFEDAPQFVHFELSILNAILDAPEVDPWTLAEIVDTHPDGIEFAAQLRMLARLRQREHV